MNVAMDVSQAVCLFESTVLPGSNAGNHASYAIESHLAKYRTHSVAVQQILMDASVT
jgi:hypothetical protein